MKRMKEPSASSFATGLFLVGLFIGLIGLFAVSGPIRSFIWELKVQCLYTEGKCRVVSSRIGNAGDIGVFELYVKHQVEVDGVIYPPIENTEEFTPTASSAEGLAVYRTRYADGSMHPCWYDVSDPRLYSVLVHNGLHPWKTLAYGAFALPLLGLSWLMMRWAGRLSPRGHQLEKKRGGSKPSGTQ